MSVETRKDLKIILPAQKLQRFLDVDTRHASTKQLLEEDESTFQRTVQETGKEAANRFSK